MIATQLRGIEQEVAALRAALARCRRKLASERKRLARARAGDPRVLRLMVRLDAEAFVYSQLRYELSDT